MTDRKWFKGANGLWSSRDRVILRQGLKEAGRQRVREIRERLDNLLKRDGWQRRGRTWAKEAT